ncbi:hypothetical protein BS50DRAFT_473072, partial [Corynespora cassiicola Philippines]
KSRQGCEKCKARQIKCDEKRPACSNCIKLGCQCPGYQQQLRWCRKYERAHLGSIGNASIGHTKQHTDSLPAYRGREIDEVANTRQSYSQLTYQSSSQPRYNEDDWLATIPPSWESTSINLPERPNSHKYHSAISPGILEAFEVQNDEPLVPGPRGLHTPVHLPTILVDYWFGYICPMRSTFDSDINYNRKLAWSTWSTSEAVSYAMQTMSAACLLDSMPQLGEILPSLKSQATAAINRGISQIQTSQLPIVTADLVFAVFALGTSLHWITPVTSKYPWLESARELLSTWRLTLVVGEEEELLFAYFTQALTYWEMLVAPMAMQFPASTYDTTYFEPPIHNLNHQILGTRPNSWCGISNEVIDVFGQVLALCSKMRFHSRRRDLKAFRNARDVLCNISLAQELQSELLEMDFGSLIFVEEAQGYCVQTKDEDTPLAHLLQTAEAYRNSALLQLHLTFDDIPMTPQDSLGGFSCLDKLPCQTTNDTAANEHYHEEYLRSLALGLIRFLEKIPDTSRSRSIHPLLYLSAAAGLRFSTASITHRSFEMTTLSFGSNNSYINNSTTPVDQLTFEITQARRLVCSRLSSLQQALPHKSSTNLLRLVRNIWLEYDSPQPYHSKIHWLDVLEN